MTTIEGINFYDEGDTVSITDYRTNKVLTGQIIEIQEVTSNGPFNELYKLMVGGVYKWVAQSDPLTYVKLP